MEGETGSITDQVFEAFLEELEAKGVDDATRTRLRKTLLVNRKLTDPALKAAVFGNNELSP